MFVLVCWSIGEATVACWTKFEDAPVALGPVLMDPEFNSCADSCILSSPPGAGSVIEEVSASQPTHPFLQASSQPRGFSSSCLPNPFWETFSSPNPTWGLGVSSPRRSYNHSRPPKSCFFCFLMPCVTRKWDKLTCVCVCVHSCKCFGMWVGISVQSEHFTRKGFY